LVEAWADEDPAERRSKNHLAEAPSAPFATCSNGGWARSAVLRHTT
jgi:hypothetical protein